MTDEPGDDNHRLNEVLKRARELGGNGYSDGSSNGNGVNDSNNLNNTSNGNSNIENSVKIHTISLNSSISTLKELSKQTNAYSFTTKSQDDLANALFDLSNLGTNRGETIKGNDKDNIIEGSGGDDILIGYKGSDTYIFNGKFDKDVIIETNEFNKDKNIIKLDENLKDIKFSKTKNDIILKTDNGEITIKDAINENKEIKISEVILKDTIIDNKELYHIASLQKDKQNILYLDENSYSFSNFGKSNFIVANKDNSSNITTSYKDDAVIGSNKNDVISTKLGNDTLIGGRGDDKLYGGFGNDIYVYKKGDGNDLIYDDGGNDTLKLQNISKDEVFFIKDNKDLLIKFKDDDTNSIRVSDHFAWKFGYHNQINSIELDDNQFINSKTIDKLIEQTNAFAKDSGIDISNINHINDDKLNQIYTSAWN